MPVTAAQTSAVADPGAFAQSGQWVPVAVGVAVIVVSPFVKKLMHLDTLADDDVGDDLEGQSEGPGEPQGAGIHPTTRPTH